ncbi:MAG: hypothetical protein LBD22_00365 [Spirochaetaceae bacterium]|jgi:hypothetical protein|nr:hypothetical protein [Spirochaetaceae bacterium]
MQIQSVRRHLLLIFLIFAPFLRAFSATPDIVELQSNATELFSSLMNALPLNAVQGLSWSDAYIGQIFSVRPHFGVGVSSGFAVADKDLLNKFFGSFGTSTGDEQFWTLPTELIEVRLGGILIPFDLGVKFGMFDDNKLDKWLFSHNYTKKFMMYGGDIRIALSKGTGAFPKISLGFGYTHFTGSLTAGLPGQHDFDVAGKTLSADDAQLELDWTITTLDLKLQLSKTLFIFTPYLGVGANFYWTDTGYTLRSSTLTYSGSDLAADLASLGLEKIIFDATSFSSRFGNQAILARVFGGFSLNMWLIKLDFSVFCGLTDYRYGGNVGVRFQL